MANILVSNFCAMLESMPAHSEGGFELPEKCRSTEFNHDDEGQEYTVFRESNGRRDEWRNAVVEGPRKDKRMPYDPSHAAWFGMSEVSFEPL